MLVLAGPKLVAAGGDLRTVGLLTVGGAFGGALAQIGIGWLSDVAGRRGVFGLALIIGAAATVLFGFADGVPALLTLSALFFLAFWAYQTVILALAGDLALPGTPNQVVALMTSAFSWGMVVGAAAAVALADTEPRTLLIVGAAAKLVALAALPWLRRPPPAERFA